MTNKFISGYWENWKQAINPGPGQPDTETYYSNDIKSFNHIYYSFLTLDKSPNADAPENKSWDGLALYESMTLADIMKVMPETVPKWKNDYEWQRAKIQALINATHTNGGKFIWAVGGWSDLTETLKADQVDAFVVKCVDLLDKYGDGIDFDWEHMSDNAGIRDQ